MLLAGREPGVEFLRRRRVDVIHLPFPEPAAQCGGVAVQNQKLSRIVPEHGNDGSQAFFRASSNFGLLWIPEISLTTFPSL